MEWQDEGVILSVRSHEETAAIAEIFTRKHGRHLGLVYGGRSRRLRPVLQTGNHVEVVWKARLSEQLGHFSLELRQAHAATILDRRLPLLGLETIAALARLLPERDPHANLYEITQFVLQYLGDDAVWPALLARWELALLEELGMGLDLERCAATGTRDQLVFVSPRTGRAVSAAAGEPYRDRLLALPAFLRGVGTPAGRDSVLSAFALTGHFLEQRVLRPRALELPEARARLLAAYRRQD
jgi:DNA repair protein RecO (recombination protein O)